VPDTREEVIKLVKYVV